MNRLNAVVCLTLVAVAMMSGCKTGAEYQAAPPPKVTTVLPMVKTIPIFHEENGETEAVEQAIVQARVRGLLEEINIKPDTLVNQGDQLFQIEQKEYLADLQAAEAEVKAANAAVVSANAAVTVADARIAAAEAEVSVSTAEFKRLTGLLEKKSIAKSEWEASQARLETATAGKQGYEAAREAALAEIKNAAAALDKAKAGVTQAKLKLDWTVIHAPISGRARRALVKEGNMVEDGTNLIEIVKNEPIWVNFNISERFLLMLMRDRSKNVDSSGENQNDPPNLEQPDQPEDAKPAGGNVEAGVQLPKDRNELPDVQVFVKRSGDVGYPFEGRLIYFDPKVDQDTGTMQLRAEFKNDDPNQRLLPGLFVRAKIQVAEQKDALLIPERAVSRDQAGTYVYVVDDERKAIRMNVTLGTKYEGMIIVASGLEAGQAVIVDGIQRVRSGLEVDPG